MPRDLVLLIGKQEVRFLAERRVWKSHLEEGVSWNSNGGANTWPLSLVSGGMKGVPSQRVMLGQLEGW